MERPVNISENAWNTARNALSSGFTIPIASLGEVIVLSNCIDAIEAYDYKFVTWGEFVAADDKPDGLFDRAAEWKKDHPGPEEAYIVYDPLDDADGFLLITSNAIELARITCEYIKDMEPEEGPLSVDNQVMNLLEAA